MVLPADPDGTAATRASYRLVWRMRSMTDRVDIVQYLHRRLDRRSWSCSYSDRQTQSAVGRARACSATARKSACRAAAASSRRTDLLRPPAIVTYDMKGDPFRTEDFLNGRLLLNDNDIAVDDDDNWTDGAVDDAHVYAGYTYDYYFKRFGRHGLDNNNIQMRSLANPVRRLDLTRYFDAVPRLLRQRLLRRQRRDGVRRRPATGLHIDSPVGPSRGTSCLAALDIVAHELTHGVTEFTSNLIYRNESGALNEAFSDMMGTSAEFFFQPPGGGSLRTRTI